MQVGIVGGDPPVSFDFGSWYGDCVSPVPGQLSLLEENNQ